MKISGVRKIYINKFIDERGFLSTIYIEDSSFFIKVEQAHYTLSKKNTLRGMHFQIPPMASNKLINLINGKIKYLLIDLRILSNTYLNIDEGELDSESNFSIVIPKGVALGYLVIADNTIVLYLMDKKYDLKFDSSINPLSIDYDWGERNLIISERDKAAIKLEDFLKDNPFQK